MPPHKARAVQAAYCSYAAIRPSDESSFHFRGFRNVLRSVTEVKGHRADSHSCQITEIRLAKPYSDIRLAPPERCLMRFRTLTGIECV